MKNIPHEMAPDSTLALAREGYSFISTRCERHQSDLFQTRIMLKKTICMKGEEAAKVFYDTNLFSRKGVAPEFVESTLFGHGGVQGMDGTAHRNRKQMFMNLMSRNSIQQLVDLFVEEWYSHALTWEAGKEVILFDETREILCKAVCAWSGVRLAEVDVEQRANDFGAMIEGPGSIGLRHWKGRIARNRTEKWIRNLIEKVRSGELEVKKDKALYTISHHRNLDGQPPDAQIAAVELINVLRPTIAVARFITFAALALHNYPECRVELESNNEKYLMFFVQEVRRFYPFFPFVMARTRKDFNWNGYAFTKHTRVLLDLYGTNHDPKIWQHPEEFNPERFRQRKENLYNFIPQGGGSHYENHRCPGEWMAIEILKASLLLLVKKIKYNVPDQNLTVRLSRVPAIPESRFIINKVRLR